MKTINILGETQREQWHSVVNVLRQIGGDLTHEGRSELCDELDRYIDGAEDVFDELRAEQEAERPQLVDKDGNERKTVAEQELLVEWAQDHKRRVDYKITEWLWGDEQDEADFREIVFAPEKPMAVGKYWNIDTLAREVFCAIVEAAQKEGF